MPVLELMVVKAAQVWEAEAVVLVPLGGLAAKAAADLLSFGGHNANITWLLGHKDS
jgi:hypothetical protein